MIRKIIAAAIVLGFVSCLQGYAQTSVTPAAADAVVFFGPNRPSAVLLRGAGLSEDGKYRFILDVGEETAVSARTRPATVKRLIDYFLIGLRLPDGSFWVNLRPDRPDDIIDPSFERTELGKVFLEADVMLKKDMAAMTDPATVTGRQYWNRLYAKADRIYKGEDCSVPSIIRPWIVPGRIVMKHNGREARIEKAGLKVMVESDYIRQMRVCGRSPAGSGADNVQPSGTDDSRMEELNEYAAALVKKLVIPGLEREINMSPRYAKLRQGYYSLVLAQYLKGQVRRHSYAAAQIREALPLLGGIDSGDLSGISVSVPWDKRRYYGEYISLVERGVYNKRERVHAPGMTIIKQYSCGGVIFDQVNGMVVDSWTDSDLARGPGLVAVTSSRDGGSGRGVVRPGLLSRDELRVAVKQSVEQPYSRDLEHVYRDVLATGTRIFDSYTPFLSEAGLKERDFFNSFERSSREPGFSWEGSWGVFREHAGNIPLVTDSLDSLKEELFVGVFENMTDTDIGLFCGVSDRIFSMTLTWGCSNRCLICGIGKLKHSRFKRYVPFPVAVKMLRRLADAGAVSKLMPYFDSEPMDYYDPVVSANIADIGSAWNKFGNGQIAMFTHGLRNESMAADVARQYREKAGPILVSAHVYHKDVLDYARRAVEHKARANEREELVAKYAGRFSSMLERTAHTKHTAVLRKFTFGETFMYLLERYDRGSAQERQNLDKAIAILQEMERVQQEVVKRIPRGLYNEIDSMNVSWDGAAAEFLKKELDISDGVIGRIQQSVQAHAFMKGLFAVSEADGSLKIAYSQDWKGVSPTVGELFPDTRSGSFQLFLRVLRFVYRYGHGGSNVVDDPVLKEYLLRQNAELFLLLNGLERPAGDRIEDWVIVELVGPKPAPTRYYDAMMLMRPDAFKDLLDCDAGAEVPEEIAEKLHAALRDMPLDGRLEYSYKVKTEVFKRYRQQLANARWWAFEHSFVPPKMALKKDLYNSHLAITLPYRAFTLNDAGSSRDGGARDMVPEGILTRDRLNSAITRIVERPYSDDMVYLYRQVAGTGAYVFDVYAPYLNGFGLQIRSYFAGIARASADPGFSWRNELEGLKDRAVWIPRVTGDEVDLHMELFSAVFEGMTDAQIKSFCRLEGSKVLQLSLTSGCSNRCLICALGQHRRSDFGRQMPFPLAIKILRRVDFAIDRVRPYSDSDPLDYFDRAVGATIADFRRMYEGRDEYGSSIITHGSNRNRVSAPEVMGDFLAADKDSLLLSVHVYHLDVAKFARDAVDSAPDDAEIGRRRAALIEKYTARYVSLIAGRQVRVRTYRLGDELMSQLDRYSAADQDTVRRVKRAAAILREIQMIQEEVACRIKALDRVEPHGSIDVIWIGGASNFLRSLGIPDALVGHIQKKDSRYYDFMEEVENLVEPDGTLRIMFQQPKGGLPVTVGDVFSADDLGAFKKFLIDFRYLMRATPGLGAGTAGDPVDTGFKKSVVSYYEGLYGRLREIEEDKGTPFVWDNVYLSPKLNGKMVGYAQLICPQVFDYLRGIGSAADISDGDAGKYLVSMREIPIDAYFTIYVRIGDGLLSYDPVRLPAHSIHVSRPLIPDNVQPKKDLYRSYTTATLPFRAFSVNEDLAGKDGGSVGGIDLRMSR